MTLLSAAADVKKPHIDIAADTIFQLGVFKVTISMLMGVVGYAIVLAAFFYTVWCLKHGRKNHFVSVMTWGYATLYLKVEGIIGDKKLARKIAPLPIALFFTILANYWIGILPFVGSVSTMGSHPLPIYRGLLADMNTTFALAIISMVTAQIYAARALGFWGNVGRYIVNHFRDPIGSFVGLLEIVSELSRMLALSLRLFGNVFAGEVLLIMVGFLTSYAAGVALLPFMLFELFIGFIQSYVFFMLTTVFISLGLVSHGDPPEKHLSEHQTPSCS